MTRTSIRRLKPVATILGAVVIGGVAIGGAVAMGMVVVTGQADSILNLFATTNGAAPLKSEADIKESGLLTGASSGDNNLAQNASTGGGVSPPASMTLVTMETWLTDIANRELKANNKDFQ